MAPIISVSNLTKTYASGFQALKNVDLEIRHGLATGHIDLSGLLRDTGDAWVGNADLAMTVDIDGHVIESVPVDPWGHPYVYLFNNEHSGVVSYGADGVPGGVGENSDISSGGLVRPKS